MSANILNIAMVLYAVVNWSKKWLVNFYAAITKVLSFNRPRELFYLPCPCLTITIKVVTLGLLRLTFPADLTWKDYIESSARFW